MLAVAEWKVPVQERSRRRFGQILDAAGDELAELGWHRFTMESVALRAQGSIGSVYRYFPNKLSLIAAFIDNRNELLLQAIERPVDAEQPFEDIVLGMIDRFGEAVSDTPGIAAVGTAALIDREAHELFRTTLDPVRQWMAAVLRDRLPKIDDRRIDDIAVIIVLAIESLLMFSYRPDTPDSQVILRETRLILRGYIGELAKETS